MQQRIFFIIIGIISLIFIPSILSARAPADAYRKGEKIKILIVPGHDNEFSGAEFNTTKEADINLQLAKLVATDLRKDKKLSVKLSRTDVGYAPELQKYFNEQNETVKNYITQQKTQFENEIKNNALVVLDQVPHADAPAKAAYQLYATNMWADQEHFDLIIHVHFNDYGSRTSAGGEFSGYSVYVPDSLLLNNEQSKTIGTDIAKRLGIALNSSNSLTELKKIDSNGVIEDHKLIALGSNRTLSVPSVLVEYSYIYEPITLSKFFATTSKMLSRATAQGVHEYLSGKMTTNHTIMYNWKSTLSTSKEPSIEVLMLQYALSELNMYPVTGMTRDDCPFSGVVNSCTTIALKNFQKSKKLSADGVFGANTRAALNKIFKN